METRYSWGRTQRTFSKVVMTDEAYPWRDTPLSKGILPVGLSRSYGDCGLNNGGTVISSMKRRGIQIDSTNLMAICESGATIGELERKSLSYGLFPVVVPGTEFVTIGGAIASDIHGKSHHRDGSFGNNTTTIWLRDAHGAITELSEDATQDAFKATIGGMGLTGEILKASIKLRKVGTPLVEVKEERTFALQETLSKLLDYNRRFEYTVAWLNLSGKMEGQGIVSGANHIDKFEHLGRQTAKKEKDFHPKKFNIPNRLPNGLVNNKSVELFNAVWFKKPLATGVAHVQKYLHPLDSVRNWNRIYGKKGFLQYQFVIPFGEEEFFNYFLREIKAAGLSSSLSVLKTFEQEGLGLLSFPTRGWTLAADFPNSHSNLAKTLNKIDEVLVSIGGRLYLTKDSRMSRQIFSSSYENLDAWLSIKATMDPSNVWQSDQGRRLSLC